MKKTLCIIAALLSSIVIMAQSADVERGCVPLEVQFTGINNLSTYFWTFGDGASSVQQNPVHTYTSAGTYEVLLREGQNGAERGRLTIEVYAKPELSIEVDQASTCAPSMVDLSLNITSADAINITKYNWSISGAIDSTARPSITFDQPGSYTVGVQIETDAPGCNVSTVVPDLIQVNGIAAQFTFETDNPCAAPATTTFTNTTDQITGLTYLWDFGDGRTSTDRDPAAITYSEEGNYEVTLSVTSSDGCVSTFTRTVQIGATDQLVEIPDTICIDIPITITNNTAARNHIWLSISSFPTSSGLREPTFLFENEGPASIRYTSVFDGGCRQDSIYEVYIQDPDAELAIDPQISCQDPFEFTATANGGLATYIWNNDTTTTSTYQGTYQVERDSLYLHQTDTVLLDFIGISHSGCIAIDSIFAIQRRPNAELTVDVARGCAPLDVTFSDISTSFEDITQYTWLFGDGTSQNNTGEDLQHTYQDPGVYQARLIIENEAGCRDTSNRLQIYVGEPITPDLENYSFDLCLGDSIALATPTDDPRIEAYQWVTDGGRQSDCWTDASATVIFDKDPGTYDIALTTEYNGCRSTVTRPGAVRVGGASAHIGYQTSCDSIYDVAFTNKGVGVSSSVWDFDGLGTSSELDPSFTFPETGDYQVTLISSDPASGCPADTARQTIYIRDLKAAIEIPEIACANEPRRLSARGSQDVHDDCFRGYVWRMPLNRPREVPTDTISHAFSQSGTNIVSVTVRDINGCTDTAFDTIEVYSVQPQFDLSDSLICLPAMIDVTNNTTSDTTIVSWEWSFGSTDEEPGLVTLTENNYSNPITLSVEDVIGCSGRFAVDLQRYIPFSTISATPRTACLGDTVRLRGTDFTEQGSQLTWDWDLGSFGSATGQEVFFVADQVGVFPIQVDYAEISSGCGSSSSFTIEVVPQPDASFIADPPNTNVLCFNSVIGFSNTSTAGPDATASWDFGGLGTFEGDTAQFIFPRGEFDVTLTIEDPAGCTDSETVNYTFVGPEGELVSDLSEICFGDDINFELNNLTDDVSSINWSFGDGTAATDINRISHTFDTPLDSNQTTVSVVLRSADSNCENTLTLPITVLQTEASFLPDSSSVFCPDTPIPFTNTSTDADTYLWDFGDGDQSTMTNPSRSFAARDTYAITLIATEQALGCSDTTTQDIIVNSPAVGLTAEPICEGEVTEIVINDYDPSTDYQISPADLGAVLSSDGIITIEGLTSTTELTVSATDGQGCEALETITLAVVPVIDDEVIDLAAFSGDVFTLPVRDDVLAVEDQFAISVDPANLSCNDCLDITFSDGITWTDTLVNVTLSSRCSDATLLYRIAVTGCDFYPNLFTPNNDNRNDIFNFASNSMARRVIEIETFQIYDRWGTLVYDNEDPRGWDGRLRTEEMAPADVYSWYSVLTLPSGDSRTCKGNVTLIR